MPFFPGLCGSRIEDVLVADKTSPRLEGGIGRGVSFVILSMLCGTGRPLSSMCGALSFHFELQACSEALTGNGLKKFDIL